MVAVDAKGVAVPNRTVTWRSSDTVVATISASGLLTARRPGRVTVTASVDTASGHVALAVERVLLRGLWVVDSLRAVAGSYGASPGTTRQLALLLADDSTARVVGYEVSGWSPRQVSASRSRTESITDSVSGAVREGACYTDHDAPYDALFTATVRARDTLHVVYSSGCYETGESGMYMVRRADTLSSIPAPRLDGVYYAESVPVDSQTTNFPSPPSPVGLRLAFVDQIGPFVAVRFTVRRTSGAGWPTESESRAIALRIPPTGEVTFDYYYRLTPSSPHFSFSGALRADTLVGTWRWGITRPPNSSRGTFRAVRTAHSTR
jgi:hypothetical protein